MTSKKYVKHFLKVIYLRSVHHPHAAGGLSLLPKFQKWGPDGMSVTYREVAGKEEVTFFRRASGGGERSSSFYMKNKLKSENRRKIIYKQKCLSAITKNLSFQILS